MILAESTSALVGTSIVRAISSSTIALREFFVFTDIALSSMLSGSIGIIKDGAGILTLSNTSNSYSGNTSINTGVLVITDTAAFPGWNINGRYSVQSGATLAVYNAVTDANVTTILGTTNFNAGSAIGFDTTSGDRTYPNAVVNTANGALGLTKLGSNILTISSNVNTYTGPTLVIAGTLATSAGNRLPDASDITIFSGATIILGGSEVLATIAGAGTLNCQGNNITLSSNNHSTFSGTLTSTANSGYCIYKTGTNIITLSGATVSAIGSIRMDTGGMILTGNTSFVQNKTSNGPRDFHLALNTVNTFVLTIGNGASLTTAGVMFGENNGGSATVNLLSGGTWNSGSGGGQSWMAGLSSIINIDGGAYSAGLFYIGGGVIAQNTTSIINLNSGSFSLTNSLIWQGAGICVFNLNGGIATFANFGQNTLTDNTFNFNGGTFTTQNGNYSYNYSNVKYRVKAGGAIFNIPNGYTTTFSTSPLITDSLTTGGGLIKNGAGILSLGSAANTFTGQVFINEGTISVTTVNNNSTNGPFGNSTFPIVLGSAGKTGILQYTTASNITTTKNFILPLGAIGTLDITGSTSSGLTITGNISGSGSLVKTGQGVMTYSGNNTYTGGTTLSAGISIVGSDTAFGTGTINFNGGSIRAHTAGSRTLTNNIIIDAASTIFNTTVGEKSLILAGPVTITGLRQLAVAIGTNVATEALIISGPIGDGGNNYQINKSSTGTLVLSGQNTFGGSLVLQAGNTRILYPTVGDIRTTAGTLQFAPGITNDISSSVRNNTQSVKIDTNGQIVTFASLSSSNIGGLLKTGTGTLILIGSGNTYTGANTVSAGELTFSGTYTANNSVSINGASNPILNITGTFTQTFTGSGVRSFQVALNAGNTGAVNVGGSAVVTLNSGMMLGDNNGGNGTFNQTGGTVNTSTGGTWLAGAVCLLDVTGGTFTTVSIECGGGTGAGTVTVSGTGTINANSLILNRGSGAGVSAVLNINGGTLTVTGITHVTTTRPATINFNGGAFTSLNTMSIPSTVTCVIKSGGAILNTSAGQLSVQSVLTTDGTGGGLVKQGIGTLALGSVAHTYTGSTTISNGTITVSKTTNSITGTATYTTTTLTVNFNNMTPNSGDTYKFFPGSTATTGLTISLINAGGKTGSYDYSTSTLTIN